jgi:hypothetical protein
MSKPNAPREGNGYHSGRKHPKSESVKDAKAVGVVSLKNAEKQNLSDGKKGKKNLAQIPASREYQTTIKQ